MNAPLILADPTPTPAVSTGAPVGPPPASQTGVGLIGFGLVCALLVAGVGLFFAMRRSLTRLRDNTYDGTFASAPSVGRTVGNRPHQEGVRDQG